MGTDTTTEGLRMELGYYTNDGRSTFAVVPVNQAAAWFGQFKVRAADAQRVLRNAARTGHTADKGITGGAFISARVAR